VAIKAPTKKVREIRHTPGFIAGGLPPSLASDAQSTLQWSASSRSLAPYLPIAASALARVDEVIE
jgi:hypothetical protein